MRELFSWRRASAEGLFVLGGILIAFWIDAWWDGRQAARLQVDLLSAVAAELQENREALETEFALAEDRLALVDRFFRLSPSAVPDVPADSVYLWLIGLMNPVTFDPLLGATLVLIETPVLEADGIAARTLANRWVRSLSDAADRRQTLWEHSVQVLRLMAPYAGRDASNGREPVPRMAGRLGPTVLGQLRADPEFVEAVALKAHWQSVYVQALQGGMPVLDSLIASLRDPVAAR